ncbi:PA2169 family four-helix-bundle protein [Dyella sp. ASV21]|uniref:PA2169 family four-helix-bundle protein n=1 Tax=Dyella sp. ASV21 TaxID=2795114 RepID=UPI0018EDB2DB|nr:PA2169 family four-helix-bundle protein [Dyella sp. ASV21]
MTNKDHEIRVLNSLIETTIDSVNGYSEAAKDAQNPAFREVFLRRANERRDIAIRLQHAVQSAGGKPEDEGTILASAHRVFVDIRSSLSKGDTAVIDEVERGEDHIKAKYESAMKDEKLSPAAHRVIDEVYSSVRSGHDEMRNLKHAMHDVKSH